MRKYLMVGAGVLLLAGSGVAWAQMPPGGPGGDGPHGPEERGGGMMWHHPHRPMPPHGTAFHFRKGDTEVDIACSDREALQNCVSGASSLMDKLGYGTATPAPAPAPAARP